MKNERSLIDNDNTHKDANNNVNNTIDNKIMSNDDDNNISQYYANDIDLIEMLIVKNLKKCVLEDID